MNKDSKIYVAGHNGMVGSAIVRRLRSKGYSNIIGRTHCELDLANQADVEDFFREEKPDYVFIAAARVGGIGAMSAQPVEFLTDNLRIQCNIIDTAFKAGVGKLLFISSSTVYPVGARQPIPEGALLTGGLDPSSEGYSVAKIAGIKQCAFCRKEYGADFISAIPANIYGPNGIFDIGRSHVIPAMLRRFHSAKVHDFDSVTIWGTGDARREFLFADDVADGCIFLMQNKTDRDCYNLGCGRDFSMMEVAETVRKVVGYKGEILTDPTKPEGAKRRLLDSSRLYKLGWKPEISLEEGLSLTYQWFLENVSDKDEIYS